MKSIELIRYIVWYATQQKIERVELKKLSPEKIKQAREKIKKISKSIKADRRRLAADDNAINEYKDVAYFKFLKALDGDET